MCGVQKQCLAQSQCAVSVAMLMIYLIYFVGQMREAKWREVEKKKTVTKMKIYLEFHISGQCEA